LSHLSFAQDNLQKYTGLLPPHITFSAQFNEPVESFLPHSLTYIAFGDKFNQSIASLPKGLKSLLFGSDFNQPVDLLPPTLDHLELGA
jgi:hypothetical protein